MSVSPFWRRFRLSLAVPALFIAAGAAPAGAGKIEWQASYEVALERAAAEQKVVFVAYDHKGEARCEHFLKKLARDKQVTALAERTFNVPVSLQTHKKGGKCPRFKGLTCNDHRRSEAALRGSVVQENKHGVVAVPQYLWIDGEGKVLYSVPFEIDREGMIWCFVAALRRAGVEDAPEFPEGARPPRRLLVGDVYRPENNDQQGRGLTPEELESLFKSMKSSFLGMANYEGLTRMLFTDEPDAVDYARVELGGAVQLMGGTRLPRTIHTMGEISPPSFWKAMADFEKIKNSEVRMEIAVALEQMATPQALKLVKGGFSREKDERVRHLWIRAMAACGAADKTSRKKVLELCEDESDPRMCANATIALGYLAPHPEVRERLIARLSSLSSDLRIAAACAMALTFDDGYVEALSAAHERCAEGPEKEALERAVKALREGGVYRLEEDVARVTGNDLRRRRIFFRSNSWGPRAPEEGEEEEVED